MDLVANWLTAVPSAALPFALATLGLILCEKAGVLNLGAEGFLTAGALAGAGAMIAGASPYWALMASVFAGVALGLVFAVLVAGLRINHVIAGLAMVFFAQALTSLIGEEQGWTNQAIDGLPAVALRQDLLIWLTPLMFLGVTWFLNRTRFGLNWRAVGENPDAADAAGINVTAMRYLAVLTGCALLGLAGGYLMVGIAQIWVDSVTGGRGWIAVALVIFARWAPWRALAGAILFGGIEALIPRLTASGIALPQYALLMTPYLATLVVMIWTSMRAGSVSAQPASLGTHHIREDRR